MLDQTERRRLKAERREELLRVAAQLFAFRGFRAVSIEELGAAAGVTGPAVYRHFSSKQQVLANLLVGVSERLLAGGSAVVHVAADDNVALRMLVAFHTDFAVTDADLIRVQDRDLGSLRPNDARLVRRLQRSYLEVWVGVLGRVDPALSQVEARTKVHAVFGLINSTSHSSGGRDRESTRTILEAMALASILPTAEPTRVL